MKFLSSIKKKSLEKETVLLRVDFNVEKFENSLRFETAIPTIEWLLAHNAKIVLLSHRGRPNGIEKNLSLASLIPFLSKRLSRQINFIDNFNFEDAKAFIKATESGALFMLENLRFNAEEEANDYQFAKKLTSLGTMFVNDAIAVSHRKNASIVAITKYLPSYAGLLFEKEFKALNNLIKKPARPLVLIIGGAKTSDKTPIIKKFIKKADLFLLGGGVGNTALLSIGIDIKNSISDPTQINFLRKIIKTKKIAPILDWAMEDDRILDIGAKTIESYKEYIMQAATIIWNGPLGLFENPKFANASIEIAKAISESKAFSIVGGGETTQLIMSLGLQNKISFLSTAGGAMLEFLAGKKLPGITALR